MTRQGATRDDRGAVAVMVALLSVLVLTMAALAVDLGNAIARSTSVQAQADHAALAGGSKLTTSVNAPGVPPAAVVNEVRDYLNNNQPQHDNDACWGNTPVDCVASSDLTNGNLIDGEVQFTAQGMKVIAPDAFVDFGFAGLVGAGGADGGLDISRTATVNVFTGGEGVLPMYGLRGCDWGSQTIGSPPSGQLPLVVPASMQFPDQTNATDLTSGSQVVRDSTGAVVLEMFYGATGYSATFRGKKFTRTTTIGFFHSNGALHSHSVFNVGATPASTPYSSSGSTEVELTVAVPSAVTTTEGIWWIRVSNDGNGSNVGWSDREEALPVQVGSAPVPCDGSSSSGNFGLLDFPRNDMGGNPSAKLAANIVAGAQTPLTVGIHAAADDGICEETDTGVIWSTDSLRKKGSNCLDTTTGDISSAATPGFIKGVTVGGTNFKGILHDRATRTGCDPDNDSAQRTVNMQNINYSLNNDTLSCFLVNPTTTLGSLATAGYAGGAAFSPDIYLSPRFVYVPVFKVKPTSGGSNRYSIVDFRPGFITDEQNGATRDGAFTGNADGSNGVIMHQNNVNQVKVFFFHINALPQDGEFPVIDHLGVGHPILRLLD